MKKTLLLFLLLFLFKSTVRADTLIQEPLSEDERSMESRISVASKMRGHLEAIGQHHELKDSEYLNVAVDSSEPIKLMLESVPQMVTIGIESVNEDTISTQITLKGFAPDTTYHKYEDNYHNYVPFTTDSNGSYTYIQDLSIPHTIFIQPKRSTKFIYNDISGGDCSSIGIWDDFTRTCTLSTDVNETIQIDSDDITLDGSGHTLTGSNTGNGIFLYNRTGVTIKNIIINKFTSGIYLSLSDNNTLQAITASDNTFGIHLSTSTNNTLTNNKTIGNYYGIFLKSSSDNSLTENNSSNNQFGIILSRNYITYCYFDCSVYSTNNSLKGNVMKGNKYNFSLGGWWTHNAWSVEEFNQDIDTSNLVDEKPVYYIKNAYDQTFDVSTNAGIFYCINCNNITIDGLVLNNNWAGIVLYNTSSSIIQNITASNNYSYGISLVYSNNNTVKDNNMSQNGTGLLLSYSDSNSIITNLVTNNDQGIGSFDSNNNNINENNTSYNKYSGIYLASSNNNTLKGNNASSNYIGSFYTAGGIVFSYSSGNTLTNNYISSNRFGLLYQRSNNNNISGNNVSNSTSCGICLSSSNSNNIYNNNFINNFRQAYVYFNSNGNIFNLAAPSGGNYWSNWTTPDADGDGFVDNPYVFNGGQDGLPWAQQEGWVYRDSVAPITTISLFGTPGNIGWYISNAQITLTATDNEGGSGVTKTEYSFDGITWITYTNSFTVNADGSTNVYYRSTDNTGNVETAITQTINIDKTPPGITATVTPTANLNGWHNTAVSVTFTCIDSTSGIAQCTSPVTFSSDGAGQGITGTAFDRAGNSASATISEINIDKTAPVITINAPLAAKYDHSAVININFTAYDGISGIYRNIVYLNGQQHDPTKPIDLLYLPLGINTLKVESENYAGLIATQSVDFEIIATADSLITLVTMLYQTGAIDNSGIANSLTQQLQAAQAAIDANQTVSAANILEAFIKLLDAQIGNHITTTAVSILKNDVFYVIGQL